MVPSVHTESSFSQVASVKQHTSFTYAAGLASQQAPAAVNLMVATRGSALSAALDDWAPPRFDNPFYDDGV